MEISCEKNGDQTQMLVMGDMTVDQIKGQRDLFLQSLTFGQHIGLDLMMVSEMDSAGLQLLILLKREAELRGQKVHIAAQSMEVTDMLDLCGMTDAFAPPANTVFC
ncbi:MAG: STAS domain-containing protein [Pseudomonadales bacterium]|nr:STAS domain-containing protein [Pseudomonadales bacterium]